MAHRQLYETFKHLFACDLRQLAILMAAPICATRASLVCAQTAAKVSGGLALERRESRANQGQRVRVAAARFGQMAFSAIEFFYFVGNDLARNARVNDLDAIKA